MSLNYIALCVLRFINVIASYIPSFGKFRPLRGKFSAYDCLSRKEIIGRVILQKQLPGTCPPGSMTDLAGFKQHEYQPWPIFWTKTYKATLAGKMLHWRDNSDLICTEGVYNLTTQRRFSEDKWYAQMYLPKPILLTGAWTSIISNWNDGSNYYHWLLDGLTRLLVRDELPEFTKILIPCNQPSFIIETLNLLGLETESLASPSQHVQIENYYFCSPTSMTGAWNPIGYQWLRKSFKSYFLNPFSGPPVFLTRRNGARVPDNLSEIESTFKSLGFDIIDCGTITVREQIRRVSSASAIGGLHGAAMTNLLWATPGTPVVEIFQQGYLNGCYEQIAFEGKLEYTSIINSELCHLILLNDWGSLLAPRNNIRHD